jgi:hypothetical protein
VASTEAAASLPDSNSRIMPAPRAPHDMQPAGVPEPRADSRSTGRSASFGQAQRLTTSGAEATG